MKILMVIGVGFWVLIAVWLVRLGLGLEHLSRQQIAPGIGGGIGGGIAGWYYVKSLAKKGVFQRKGK